MSDKKFKKILEPLQVGSVRFRNRMVSAPHSLRYEKGGYAEERGNAFYEAVAKGGVGMIVVGCFYVDTSAAKALDHLFLDNDKFVPKLSELVSGIHKHGCPTFAQLGHPGPGKSEDVTGSQAIGASSLINENRLLTPDKADRPGMLTAAGIEELQNKFIKAAELAGKAGFDGVEVHCGHTYLLNSFLSRAWNKRQDAYGCQDLENRARFAVEIIRTIKKHQGQDFPVGVRINGGEWGVENGITSEESQSFARLFEKAGADYISVTGYGSGRHPFWMFPDWILFPECASELAPMARQIKKPGALISRAEAIKKVVSVPVIGVGRLGPELGEWLLREGKVDLIALGRRLLANPELPNKVASGRLEDIAPCTACLNCSKDEVSPRLCRINAALGQGHDYAVKPAEKKRRVMVVGGGPAGMEAARVAALRGHDVTLYDREHKLGGLVPVAALVKGLEVEDLVGFVSYFNIQLTKLGVNLRLGREVNQVLVNEINPDVIILAIGGVPVVPEIPGINGRNVVKIADLHHRLKTYLRFLDPSLLRWLTRFWMPLGKRVVILGGRMQGCELAEFLVKRGRQVTILEESSQLGTGFPDRVRGKLVSWLAEKGVTAITDMRCEEITDKGIVITTKSGTRQTIETDNIVPAIPLRPNTELYNTLRGKFRELYLIGDGREPHLILEAIHEGSRIARAI